MIKIKIRKDMTINKRSLRQEMKDKDSTGKAVENKQGEIPSRRDTKLLWVLWIKISTKSSQRQRSPLGRSNRH